MSQAGGLTTGANHRLATISPSQPIDSSGIHLRQGSRERKPSLSDGIAVERIAALDQHEPFKEATEDINKESESRRDLSKRSE